MGWIDDGMSQEFAEAAFCAVQIHANAVDGDVEFVGDLFVGEVVEMAEAVGFGELGGEASEGLGEVVGEFGVLEVVEGLEGVAGEGGEVGFGEVAGAGEGAFSEEVEGAGGGEGWEEADPVGDGLSVCEFHGGEEGFLEAVGGVGVVAEEAEGGLPDDGGVLAEDVGPRGHVGPCERRGWSLYCRRWGGISYRKICGMFARA